MLYSWSFFWDVGYWIKSLIYLTFLRKSTLASITLTALYYIPTNCVWHSFRPLFFYFLYLFNFEKYCIFAVHNDYNYSGKVVTFLPDIFGVYVYENHESILHKKVSRCISDLYLFYAQWSWKFIHKLIGHLNIFFWEVFICCVSFHYITVFYGGFFKDSYTLWIFPCQLHTLLFIQVVYYLVDCLLCDVETSQIYIISFA